MSRRDLLAAFDRPDAEIAAGVAAALATSEYQGDVSAEVAAGVVTLDGRVRRTEDLATVCRLAWLVPGVIDVIYNLTVDDGTFGPRRDGRRSRSLLGVHVDSNGLEILDRTECLRLLGNAVLGRVAVTADALPSVLPVTFKLVGDRILFRTSPGTKLDAATRDAVVAFEVDEFDVAAHTGWSVLVTGVATEITDPHELAAARRLELPRWAPSPGDRIVAVSIELVSGRRIVSPAP